MPAGRDAIEKYLSMEVVIEAGIAHVFNTPCLPASHSFPVELWEPRSNLYSNYPPMDTAFHR